MRRLFAALIAGLVAVALAMPVSAAAGKGKADVHKPPYKKGNQGGDQWNFVHADPQTGELAVLRLFPGISPVVGCEPEPAAGWATFKVPHRVKGPIDKVTINFEGAMEPYSWITAVVWDSHHESLGVDKFQGPHAGPGALKVKLFRRAAPGSEIIVEFGAQLGDSCPQAGGAAVSFPSIEID